MQTYTKNVNGANIFVEIFSLTLMNLNELKLLNKVNAQTKKRCSLKKQTPILMSYVVSDLLGNSFEPFHHAEHETH